MRDVPIICVIAEVSLSAISCRTVEGMGSREQVVGLLERRRVDMFFFFQSAQRMTTVMRCLMEVAECCTGGRTVS